MTPSLPDRLAAAPASDGPLSRRELLAAVGGATAVSRPRLHQETVDAAHEATVHVRAYPVATPLWVRMREGVDGLQSGWGPPHRDALGALEDAFAQIREYARETGRLTDLAVSVERGPPIRLPAAAVSRPSDVVAPSLETVLSGFAERLRDRDTLTGSTCHLLLPWSPLNYRIGYGGTLSPNSRLGDDSAGTSGDALTVANVGATDVWDSRAITRNMAIHEALHTFLAGDVVETVGETSCDHDLGVAERIGDGTMRVSPMATAYAGPDEVGGGTRFHGTGCADHGAFYRHDGHEGVDDWSYTTDLSPATLEAVTRYLERYTG